MNELITAPGLYDLPSSRYHDDPVCEPSLSNTIAKKILNDSPLHAAAHHPRIARMPIREEKDAFDLGHAAHTLLLRDNRPFEVVDRPNWQGNIDGIKSAEFKARARAEGKIPILRHQFEQTVEMAEACRAQLAEHEVGDLLADGKGEQTIVWKEGDVWCRALIDWLPLVIEEGCIFVDYKSTMASAHPALWAMRTGPAIGFDFQKSFYERGIRKVLKLKNFKFLFVVQERQPPWCISVIEIGESASRRAMGNVKTAVSVWRQCIKSGHWPGYPGHIVRVSPKSRMTPDIAELEDEDDR